MWGNISTEATYLTNFNLGFSNNTSDVLIHLGQWQYWWWFWFAFVWVLYYLIILRTIRHRLLKFRPRIVNSFRPHGKWGDLLVCVIPVSWCVNIIINSSFILKMIEWQNESSLFTIRIRGRQWYWVYKYELKAFTDILSAPKNIGNNHWQVATPGDIKTADDYLHVLQLRSQNRWIKNYWNDVLVRNAKVKKNHVISSQEKFKLNFSKLNDSIFFLDKLQQTTQNSNLDLKISSDYLNNFDNQKLIFDSKVNFFVRLKLNKINWDKLSNGAILENSNNYNNTNSNDYFFLKNFLFFNKKQSFLLSSKFWGELFDNNLNSVNRFSDFSENTRFVKRSYGNVNPIRVIKNTFNDENSLENLTLFRFRFNANDVTLKNKITPGNIYLTLKQKKYKIQKNIRPKTKSIVSDFNENKKIKKTWTPVLINNSIFDDNSESSTQQYRMIKKNRKRQEVFSVALNRRLLRTKKTLVVPAHVNITAITNSYDVVHSWFIPGLGLKIDCIPGRSTHHTFFVDNVGFYYGQCAEICGRYHHHMPVRLCALPFEHFLVWWNTFGLPKLLFTNNQKRFSNYYSFRKYVW